MARRVILPKDISVKLNKLTEVIEEVNGILLYRKQDNYCPIEALFMTGIGSVGHVQAQPERIEITNEFLSRNSEYQFVKFHTHSKGTIKRFGDFYATNFSPEDIESYNEQLKTYSEFIGMVATPKTKLLYAPDNPTLKIVNGFPSEANKKILQELQGIAKSMNYDLESFKAKRKQKRQKLKSSVIKNLFSKIFSN